MHLELSPDSRVLVDLQATGLLRAVGHDPTLTARPQRATLDTDAGNVSIVFQVRDVDPPADLSASDRDKMIENLRSPDVLDAARFPTVEVRGRYDGTREAGTLAGDVVVRGAAHRLRMELRAAKRGEEYLVTGTWEGKLTDLGIKPFHALLGALKLKDWIRLRVEARLTPAGGRD
jgi:YceI-like domain